MRQSAPLLVWLALLTLAPGCALFGGGAGGDGSRKIEGHWEETIPQENEMPIEPPAPSEPRPTVKLLQVPSAVSQEVNIIKSPGVMGAVTLEPIKPAPVGTGIGTFDILLDPLGVKNTAAQGPPPLPPLDKKSELAPLTQAVELMLAGRHQEAIKVLDAYDKETQEFFLRVLPLLTMFARTPLGKMSPGDIDNMNDILMALRESLRPRCALLVNRMLPCKDIGGFGRYNPLPDNHAFLNATKDRPGELVQLYVELQNFASVKDKDGMYLTKLACSVELRDSNDKRVCPPLRFDDKETTYRLSACLNDYHGNFSFYVPPIPAGTYKLILNIVDETIPNVRRIARKELDFRVTPVANQTTLSGG